MVEVVRHVNAMENDSSVAVGGSPCLVGQRDKVECDICGGHRPSDVLLLVSQFEIGEEAYLVLPCQNEVFGNGVVASVLFCQHLLRFVGFVISEIEVVVHLGIHEDGPLTVVISEEQHAELLRESSEVEFSKRETIVGDEIVKFASLPDKDRFCVVDAPFPSFSLSLDLQVVKVGVHGRQSLLLYDFHLPIFRHVGIDFGEMALVEVIFVGEDGEEEVSLDIIVRPCILFGPFHPSFFHLLLRKVALVCLQEKDGISIERWEVELEMSAIVGFHLHGGDVLSLNKFPFHRHFVAQSPMVDTIVGVVRACLFRFDHLLSDGFHLHPRK